jgi:hypothetical protein
MRNELTGSLLNLPNEGVASGELIALNRSADESDFLLWNPARYKLAVAVLTLLGSRRESHIAGVWIKPGTHAESRASAIAGPGVVLRISHYLGSNWVEINITSAGKQIAIRLYGTALKPSFPRCASALLEPIDPTSMPASQPFHQQTETAGVLSRVDDQVNVIRHQAVAVDSQIERLPKLAKALEVRQAIAVRDEHSFAVVPTLDNVMWVAWHYDAATSWHPCLLR